MTFALNLNSCRLCQENPKQDEEINMDLVQIIFDLLQIDLKNDLNNYLPKNICLDCEDFLVNFNNFRCKIQTVDRQLQELLKAHEKCDKCFLIFGEKKRLENHFLEVHSKKRNLRKDNKRSAKKTENKNLVKVDLKSKKHFKNENKIDDGKEKIEEKKITIEVPKEGLKIQCNNCQKSFDNEDLLKKHLITHKQTLFHKCRFENCKEQFSSYYSYKKHICEHEGKSFLCSICGKSFLTKASLKNHEKIHNDQKAYVCETCNLRFSVRCNLRTHIRLHHEGVRFYCSQCPREFKRKNDLNRHEKIHEGVKDFRCDLCSSAFYSSKELKLHRRYHLDDKRFQCEHCFKKFFTKHHLNEHTMIHTGERPFKCPLPGCEKSFVSSRKLKRHQNSGHNNLNNGHSAS